MLNGTRPDIDPDRIFSPFDLTRRAAVVAAVSGGSDSLAMLLLLQGWLTRHAPAVRLVAVTVDHRLRSASAAEARSVAHFCAERGIAHRTAAWTGGKPATGLSAAARLARYGLLANAAVAEGTDIVLTGHTADDQAETVAMRQVRGEGRGLAGMALTTLFDGRAWIVRPLLGTRRESLRQFLRGEGVSWIDDPTNVEPAYERARVRRELRVGAADRHRVETLLATAKRAGALRVALAHRAAGLIQAHAEQPMQGLVHLSAAFAETADDEAALLALRALLAVLGGVGQLPDAERAATLLRRMRTGSLRATLSRCVVDLRKTGVFLYREKRGLPEGAPVFGAIWDGRYEILDGSSAPSPDPILLDAALPASIVSAVRATMPQVDGADFQAVPILAPWRQFLPSFDLVLVQAVAGLIGAAKIPPPPFTGNNGAEG